jgi:hypothetical protein
MATRRHATDLVGLVLVGLLGATGSSGCGGGQFVSADDVQGVTADVVFSDCQGYCRQTTDVHADLAALFRELPTDPALPDNHLEFTITPRDWKHISKLASMVTREAPSVDDKCDDCDEDQWTVTIHTSDGDTRRMTIEHDHGEPTLLQSLIDTIVEVTPTPFAPDGP